MNSQEAYDWLLGHNKETAYLGSMMSLLNWDQRTCIPAKGQAHRAAQIAVLAKLIHVRMTDPKIADMLTVVEGSNLVSDHLSVPAVNVREWRRSFDRASKIPERLAVELAKASAEGETAWESARPANDWMTFKPYLERIVALKREEADLLGSGGEPYDALMDAFEPGETAQRIEPLFTRLRDGLVKLLERIDGSSRRPDRSILTRHFPRSLQESFAREALKRIGYDFESSRIDASAHPFSSGIGPGDVRITSRYDEHAFGISFFSSLHEAGHAMYEMGLPQDYWGTPMGEAVSLGIHESQSRMWENLVGRSFGFWEYFFSPLQQCHTAFSGIPVEAFWFAVNDVHPSLVRTEADEVTYNLHVMLRFELELALIRGELNVSSLPDAWNSKMEAYLGLTPPDYSLGVMQDIHWAGGAIGYFPTYTLGNMYAAQFFSQADQDLRGVHAMFSAGRFDLFLNWLRQKIHVQGSRYLPRDLVRFVTGEDLNPQYLVRHLEDKFNVLYGL